MSAAPEAQTARRGAGILWLAWRDLLQSRFFLFCNTAMIVAILVPMLVLFGVKNGVYNALVQRMLSNPATLQIDTSGNGNFSADQVDMLRSWPEVAFVTAKTRSLFDFVNVRKHGGGPIRDALIQPSGSGDPTLPKGVTLGPEDVAVSSLLASQLALSPGDTVDIVSQAEGRPRQLLLTRKVATVLSPQASSGRTVLAPLATPELLEAFYDNYALPDYGITDGRPLSTRVESYAGIRVYARTLDGLGPLQAKVEATLGVQTEAKTREVETLLNLGRNLNLALGLAAVLSAAGLIAALVFTFWIEVRRKRPTLAMICLLGLPSRRVALLPVIQAALTAALALAISYPLYRGAGIVAAHSFGRDLPPGQPITLITLPEWSAITLAVFGTALLAAAVAGWSVMRIDPATVLREDLA